MDALQDDDVPYGNDWNSPAETAAYGDAADRARPWRAEMRDRIAGRIATLRVGARVLELGSGPGLLAHAILQRCANVASYTLLDFSEPMLALSRARLAPFAAASFVHASFRSEEWMRQVGGGFDGVVSMQAVHELRHKRHAPRLYEQIRSVLAVPGVVLICDHAPFDASPKSVALYMTEQEQRRALADAGFVDVRVEAAIQGLMLYEGAKAV